LLLIIIVLAQLAEVEV